MPSCEGIKQDLLGQPEREVKWFGPSFGFAGRAGHSRAWPAFDTTEKQIEESSAPASSRRSSPLLDPEDEMASTVALLKTNACDSWGSPPRRPI